VGYPEGSLGRLHVITDTRGGRDPLPDVRAALGAGAPVIQVRLDRRYGDRDAYELAARCRRLCAAAGAQCLVNDRVHVAAALAAHGVHVGPTDLPVAATRRVLGPAAVVGATARDPRTARAAVAEGATYLGVGPSYRTSTKDGLPAPIGPAGVAAVAASVPVPVIAIGGVTAARVPELLSAGAYGVAVVGAVSAAADPAEATRRLLQALREALAATAAPGR
jgi:thiamine-phosphate pyrophosphorylase